eukprot:3491387-Rhodomonas_salina.1
MFFGLVERVTLWNYGFPINSRIVTIVALRGRSVVVQLVCALAAIALLVVAIESGVGRPFEQGECFRVTMLLLVCLLLALRREEIEALE